MVTILYDNFAIAPPQMTPDGGMVLPIWETDDDGNPSGRKHIFPMGREAAEQLHKAVGELLGQKIETANLHDMKEEAKKHGKRG